MHPGESRCTAAALAFLQQQRFGLRGTFCEHSLEALSNGGPFLALDGGSELLHLGDERVGVEQGVRFMRRGRGGHASTDIRSFTPCHGLARFPSCHPNKRCDASRAPSRRLASFAHTTSSATRPQPAEVSKPQSVPPRPRPASPTTPDTRSRPSATTSGCSTQLVW